MDLAAYRSLLRDSRTRHLLAGLAVSALGDVMSIVTIAWLALAVCPLVSCGIRGVPRMRDPAVVRR